MRSPSAGWRGRVVAGSAALLAAGSLAAQEPEVFIVQAELFTNVTVIDGRGGAPRPETSILVWGGEIRAVGARSQIAIPEGTTVVDLEGAWVVPGFIDAHASPRTRADFEAMVASGITGVREAGLSNVVHRESGGHPPGGDPRPTWFVGGPALATGDGGLATEAEAVDEIDRQATNGAAFVTLGPSIPEEWLVRLLRVARSHDTPVWSDRRGVGWLTALRAGVDVASRLVSEDPDLLAEEVRTEYEARLAGGRSVPADWLSLLDPGGPEVDRAIGALLSRDATVIPLLAAAQAALGCMPGARGCSPLPESEAERLRAAWPAAQALVRKLHGEGVRLLVGSDSPGTIDPGAGFHRELQLLVEAGVPAVDALGMATRNGAIALGQLHDRGTLEVGKRADFVVLEDDPLADIGNARRIAFVLLGGRAWRSGPEGGLERLRFR